MKSNVSRRNILKKEYYIGIDICGTKSALLVGAA